jgi:hypothetical protein
MNNRFEVCSGHIRRATDAKTLGIATPPTRVPALLASTSRRYGEPNRASPSIRWCPTHKDIPGSEKSDEWGKLAAERPDARGVEWLKRGARPTPHTTSLAHLKRGISKKKRAEPRQWAGGRVTSRKYRMPREQQPDKMVAGSSKRHAPRFYQLKTGHRLTG